MRHVPYWVIILLVMACNGGNDEKKEHSILSMKVDTVIIEPGEELLYLQSRLRVSGLSANKNTYIISIVRKMPLKRSISTLWLLRKNMGSKKKGLMERVTMFLH